MSASASALAGGAVCCLVGDMPSIRRARLLRNTPGDDRAAEVLWTPSPERVQRATLTRYQAWVEQQARADVRALRGPVALVGGRSRRVLVLDRRVLRCAPRRGRRRGARQLARCPALQWFPGHGSTYAEHVFRGKDDDGLAIQHASELRPLSSWTWGELRAQTAAIAAGLRALGVGRGRPRRGVHAEHPRDGRGRSSPARRSARSGPRPRPSSARAA